MEDVAMAASEGRGAGGARGAPAGLYDGGGPLYKNLEGVIVRGIVSSGAKPGDVVGTLGKLAREHGVSVGTVKRSVAGLAARGWVRLVRNRGIMLTAEAGELAGSVDASVGRRTFHFFLGRRFLPSEWVDSAQVLAGIEGRLAQARARVEMVMLPDNPTIEGDFVLDRLSEGTSGVFTGELYCDMQHVIDECERRRVPLVFLEPLVTHAYRLGAHAAGVCKPVAARLPVIAEKLAQYGHRRIACAGYAFLIGTTIGKWLREAAMHDFQTAEELVIHWRRVNLHEVDLFARHVVDTILSMEERPTALLVIENCMGAMTTAVVGELRSRGLAVGKDISVVSTEVGLLATKGNGAPPAGTRPSPFAEGAAGADAMLALADGSLTGPETITLGSDWVEGDTLGAAPVVSVPAERGARR